MYQTLAVASEVAFKRYCHMVPRNAHSRRSWEAKAPQSSCTDSCRLRLHSLLLATRADRLHFCLASEPLQWRCEASLESVGELTCCKALRMCKAHVSPLLLARPQSFCVFWLPLQDCCCGAFRPHHWYKCSSYTSMPECSDQNVVLAGNARTSAGTRTSRKAFSTLS